MNCEKQIDAIIENCYQRLKRNKKICLCLVLVGNASFITAIAFFFSFGHNGFFRILLFVGFASFLPVFVMEYLSRTITITRLILLSSWKPIDEGTRRKLIDLL